MLEATMIDPQDFLQFLLGVFRGQTAALPPTVTVCRQLFVSLLTTLLPKAGITEQTVSEVMVLHQEFAGEEFRQRSGRVAHERSVPSFHHLRFAGHCLGYLLGRGIKSGDFGVTLQLREVVFPEHRTGSYPTVHFTRAVRRLCKEGYVEVIANGLTSQLDVIRFTPAFQKVLQAVLVTSQLSPTCATSQQHQSRA